MRLAAGLFFLPNAAPFWPGANGCGIVAGAVQAGAASMPVDKQAYRDAMARFGAAVNVITTAGPGGRAGFTASAVCSVTDTPPTLLVCANRTQQFLPGVHGQHGAMREHAGPRAGGTFATVRRIDRAPMEGRFGAATWHTLATGAPVLDGAAVAFDCRIDKVVEVGTHDVFFCVVEAVELGPVNANLIYYARRYHSLVHS